MRLRGVQGFRNGVQVVVAVATLWVGYRFFLFVSHFRNGTEFVPRPPSVEAFLPIANLMALKSWVVTGEFAHVHPAGLAVLLATLLVGVLFHRGFCSWLCPVGLLEEVIGRFGIWSFDAKLKPPWPVDYGLRSLKYLVLGFFAKVVLIDMDGAALRAFLESPYNVVAMVRMLDFWLQPGTLTLTFVGLMAIASLFVTNFWCRYLCPYGALVGVVGVLSPFRIERTPESCIGCGTCSRNCLNHIDVMSKETVKSQECTRCFRCVDNCPSGSLSLSRVSPWVYGAAVVGLFFLVLLVAKVTGHWETSVTYAEYQELVPMAEFFTHDTGM